ncbi:acyl-CoA thioesterase/BAAT N-terminal domain-containing protein [Bacillus cereus]
MRASRIAEGLNDIYLESQATFIATKDGNVNITEQAPITGSYTGIDGMGLFWSLDIIKISEHYDSTRNYKNPLSPQNLTLSLEINGSTIDEINISRLWKAKQIVRYPIRENGLVATFFYNENKKANPGIIVLGGSEGGLNEYLAALLASHNFSVLTLAYFGIDNLPKQLVEIPLNT